MDPGAWLFRGSMLIQVRSVLESQEWLVMVEPSTDASLPTSRLVQHSVHGWSEVACGSVMPAWDGQAASAWTTAEHWRLDWKAKPESRGRRIAAMTQAARRGFLERKGMARNSFRAKGLGHRTRDDGGSH
jgi:hypothetical protein